MNRIIKQFGKFDKTLQEDIYTSYSYGDLERTTFPFQGEIVSGVIYPLEDSVFLVPISGIVKGKAGVSESKDDDDDDDNDVDVDDEIIGIEDQADEDSDDDDDKADRDEKDDDEEDDDDDDSDDY